MDEFQLCIVYRLLLLAFVRPVVGGSSEEGDRVVGYDPPRLTLRLSCPCFWPGPSKHWVHKFISARALPVMASAEEYARSVCHPSVQMARLRRCFEGRLGLVTAVHTLKA